MNNFNKSKLALGMVLALSAIAFNPSLAVADDANKPDVAIVTPSVAYDVDYMDEGVRVIIPKLLTEVKLNEDARLDYGNKFYAGKNQEPTRAARDFDDSVAVQYKSLGFDIDHTNVFRRGGTEVNQFLAFPIGNPASLDNFNKNFGKANFIDSIRTFTANAVGVVAGATIGGALGGTQVAILASTASLSRDSTGNFNIKNAQNRNYTYQTNIIC